MVKRCVIADVRRTCTVPGTAYAFLQFDDFPVFAFPSFMFFFPFFSFFSQ